MPAEFTQRFWSTLTDSDIRQILQIALSEDLDAAGDLTSLAMIPHDAEGTAEIVSRSAGILAGAPLIPQILMSVDRRIDWMPDIADSDALLPGTRVGTMSGFARSLLAAERTVLNFIGRLSGIASLTHQFVTAVQGTPAKIYDTRKTTPGWRLLEKYAVRCGGGTNHRSGLYDAVLIKDNHLAFGRQENRCFSPAEAVRKAKDFLKQHHYSMIVEIEADTLDQLREVLPEEPHIVLLDNMQPEQIAEAVKIRNQINPHVQLEASGGVHLKTVRSIAETGVERISAGALTHSAVSLDFGLDWI
ncbi:MAG: carboxylating nicotinate-nucleotide diphosphorylase [Planctomycetaceae bacterium]|jgi:nicotinate-nucleotide pyrophosphorylase (carboxylating)|nr:carboxylating nicotinate-nucleotide diphosphorylase [Planctomycetaceae bacterium]